MFSEWLITKLKELNWSQADLSRATGLTTGAVSNYVNGRIPDEAALKKIAKAFKLPPDLVFEKAGILPPKNEDTQLERAILSLVKNLPVADQEAFHAMLETWESRKSISPKTAPKTAK